MHSLTKLILLADVWSALAAPATSPSTSILNLDARQVPAAPMPVPPGYSTDTCPAAGNAWEGQNLVPRSLASLIDLPTAEALTERDSTQTCSTIALANIFCPSNYHNTGSLPIRAGVQYFLAFGADTPVNFVKIWTAATNKSAWHLLQMQSFRRTAGSIAFTVAADCWVHFYFQFVNSGNVGGTVGLYQYNVPSEIAQCINAACE